MGDFKEHGIMLYLDKVLYRAFIKLQAEKGLGRSYAGLLPFTEGLYRMGYLSNDDYEEHVQKYSQGLVQPKPLTLEQIKEKEENERLNRLYSTVLKAWPTLNEKAKAYHIKKAKELADRVPNAKLVLALANNREDYARARTEFIGRG